jgi:3'-phosphoadenosine 5'-phosphosulfate sulfotransferase (PAPS reductase)/FAD synthetase
MNPYLITEPTTISFSGGRSSGLMLHKCIEAHNGKLPDYAHITFANTGREMPETLDFVKECGEKWGVEIIWLERYASELAEPEGRKKYSYDTKQVTYETAARNGEPLSALIKARRYMPNPVARFCTVDTKIRAIGDYMKQFVGDDSYTGFIGIRADEVTRAMKMQGTREGRQDRHLPMYLDGITRQDVSEFWKNQDFDLNLPNNDGVTDWGNCDLCFLKGVNKKISIIRERPDLATWWIEQEWLAGEAVGKGAYFRNDHPSYAQMLIIATDQPDMFAEHDDETIPCFCGD